MECGTDNEDLTITVPTVTLSDNYDPKEMWYELKYDLQQIRPFTDYVDGDSEIVLPASSFLPKDEGLYQIYLSLLSNVVEEE